MTVAASQHRSSRVLRGDHGCLLILCGCIISLYDGLSSNSCEGSPVVQSGKLMILQAEDSTFLNKQINKQTSTNMGLLKIDGWKMKFLFKMVPFQVTCLSFGGGAQ